MIKKNKTCRACLSKKLTQILSYKKSPIGDEYITEDRLNIIQPLFPIDTYQCIDCGFTQLLDVIDPEVLYGNYIYNTRFSILDLHYFFIPFLGHLHSASASGNIINSLRFLRNLFVGQSGLKLIVKLSCFPSVA